MNTMNSYITKTSLTKKKQGGGFCWVLWSLVVLDPVDDPTRNNVAWFLMGDFLRFSPGNFFCPFCNLLWILCTGYRKHNFGDYGFINVVFEREKKLYCRTLYFSLIIVKSLQLRGRRQIAESHKYCHVHMIIIFFFRVCFLYFFVSYRLRISCIFPTTSIRA